MLQVVGANPHEVVKLEETMLNARKELNSLTSKIKDLYVPDLTRLFTGELERLRWTILPSEAKELLITSQDRQIRRRKPPLDTPFKPKVYPIGKRMGSAEESIGSLHGGVLRVSNPSFLLPAPEATSAKQNTFVKHVTKIPANPKKWSRPRPLSGFWPKEKLSKSKSIESMVAATTKHDDSFSFTWNNNNNNTHNTNDYENIPGSWNKTSMEEKMISYMMKEFIASNKDKIFQQKEIFGLTD